MIEKRIYQLKEEDFDKYGFAKIAVLPNFNAGYYLIRFCAKDPKANIILNNGKLTIDGLVTYSCPLYIEGHEILEEQLEKMDIVETIKFLLQNDKKNIYDNLMDMPSCLYKNRQVAEEIFLCIPHEKEILEKCTKAIRTKLAIMKKYEENERQNAKTPAELQNELFTKYYEGLSELNKSKE